VDEFEAKVEKLRELMKREKLVGILLSRVENFSWITCGGRSWVVENDPIGVASVLVTEKDVYLISNNIEMERLLKEEVPSAFQPLEYKWYESEEALISKLNLSNLGSDTGNYNTRNVAEKIKHLRTILTPWEIERYKKYGEELQEVFETAVERLTPEMTEFEAKGQLQKELSSKGFEVPVLLIFSDTSRRVYRHNIPRNVKLGKAFFASTCAGKGGLILAVTRMVSFVDDPDLEGQYLKNAMIDAAEFIETRPGRTLGEMFQKIKEIYEKYGVGREFELHHQGGIIGYLPREEIAKPSSKTLLTPNMAVAWNPTITGTKLEDTILMVEENEYVTFTKRTRWPVLEVEIEGRKIKRPGILKK